MTKHFVYIAQCSDDTLYTGYTTDIHKREIVHNLGKGAKYTRSRLPLRIVYFEEHKSRSEATKREYEIKQMQRVEKERLFN